MNRKVVLYLLIFVALCSGLNGARADSAFYEGTADLPRNDKWMSWLSDDVRIRDISIPGTHDSGSRFGITNFSHNQTLTIPQQLNAGIRFLDVRARHINNTFTIHHGEVFQNYMFADVMRNVASFLNANPSEFVFIRVKQEHTPENVTRSFEQTFEYYRKIFNSVIWKPATYNPTLAEVRGRIVFIQDFSSYQLPRVGLSLGSFNVQDQWGFNMFNLHLKEPVIKKTIDDALVYKSNVINNLAISAPIYVPKQTAAVFNNITLDYLNKKVLPRPLGNRYVGILPMDYPGAGIIDAIIRTNNVSCSTVYLLDAKTRQLATCFGRSLAFLTDAKAYSAKCDGSAQWTKDGVVCYVANTNTLKPLRLELQATCSGLGGHTGRYLSCDTSQVATHTAPVIACNGFFNVASGLCTDMATKQVKPLDLSCYGAPANVPSDSIGLLGCAKPRPAGSPLPISGGSSGSLIRPGSQVGR